MKLTKVFLAATVMAAGVMAVAQPAQAAQPAINFLCGDSPTPQIMIDIDGTFAHRDNTWTSPEIGRMLKFQCYPVLGRDNNSEWVVVPYGNSNAWVHVSAVRFKDGTNATQLPSADKLPAPKPPVAARYAGVPTVSKTMQQLYQQGVKAGRAANIVTVVGDCNSEHPVFFGRYAAGVVSLAPYSAQVQKAAKLFAPSFKRISLATSGSFNAAMAFDGTWTDPGKCNGDGPLPCELQLSNASIVLISLGTGDTFTWQTFEEHYKRIIDYALSNKVVPVLLTKADALETHQGGAPDGYINGVVRKLGAQYGVPVIDFALAAKDLPNSGLAAERNADLQPIDPFHVNESGMDARIIMTLQTLAQIPGKLK